MEKAAHFQQYTFQTAGKIVAGRHSLQTVARHLPVLGPVKNALIVTQNSMIQRGFTDELKRQLSQAGVSVYVLGGVMQEPTVDNINELNAKITEPFDVYIGIGGGSVLDATKILSVLKTNDTPIEQMLGIELVKNAGIPTVLIPTTSGTGSEVTPNAIVTIPAEELKVGIVSRHLLPRLVILDPVLTLGLPKPITAATGMDAFTHAFESYISNKANPISDMFALESIRKISKSMTAAYHDGSNLDAREDMIVGSMYGGMALTAAGTAAVHALAYPLGGKFNIPHGVANSMLLPHVTEFNLDAVSDRLVEVARAMGLSEGRPATPEHASDQVIGRIVEWIKEMQIPQDLTQYGVSKEDVSQMAIAASKVTRLLDNNPKKLSLADMESIYRKLLP
jgi:alcohol dehydrogenase class IV